METKQPTIPLDPEPGPPAWLRPDQPGQPPGPPPAPPSDRPARAAHPWRRRVVSGALLVALALGSGTTGAVLADRLGDPDGTTVVTSSAPVGGATATAPSERLARVAAAVQPSVVSVTVSGASGSAEGSGVILRSDGTILTNNHVVEGAGDGGSLRVRFADGRTAAARLVGRDPSTDLAVIRAQGVSGLKPATLGSSAGLHVGDTVLALGSPLGLDGSVTAGIVSALHRTVDLGGDGRPGPSASLSDAIQTDAAINPGNSGGPLVDANGAVVGINTAIASLGGGGSGNIGVGFAIPVDEARSVAEQLIAGRTPRHALLGVEVSDDPSGGALIGQVTPGSGADRAGLRTGDVVTRVDATPIADGSALAAAIRSRQPGDKVVLTYRRDGQERTATVTLGSASG
jgi:putative serine protease PepD